MSQHDFVIDNQSFPATRTDLNAAILAVASNSSGATAPTTNYANQFWYDTSTNILYIRNEANDGWVSVITLDASMTAAASELNQLDAITRGSILYGNASGDTARLAAGGASTVLTSDGTDIAWAATAGGVATGTVVSLATSAEPTGYLECDGAAVSRSTYSDLFSTIASTYGAGDGSSTFNLPDLRGEFIRGFDNSRGVDASRVFGSAQANELESHNHIGGFSRASGFTYSSGRYGVDTHGSGSNHSSSSSGTYTQKYPYTSSTGGTETRPRNIALMYCIKT